MIIVVPYRNRPEHLHEFRRVVNENFRIPTLVVEQGNDKPFNRGWLLNVGYLLVNTLNQMQKHRTFIFHDVDMIPESVANYVSELKLIDGSIPYSVIHLATAASQFGYTMPYANYFGGVTMFSLASFYAVNGFSNLYQGWGCEDDDLFQRVNNSVYKVHRIMNNRFESLPHLHNGSTKETQANEKYFQQVLKNPELSKTDGLNTCRYRLIQLVNKGNYWHAIVDEK